MVHSNRILSYYQWVRGCHKIYLCYSQLLALGLAQAFGLHRAIGVERAMIARVVVIQVNVWLQTSTSRQVLSHFRTESNLLNAVGSTLWVDVHRRNIISTIGISNNPRCYLLGTACSGSTNFCWSLGGLSSLHAALADEAFQEIGDALVLGDFGAKITMSSRNAQMTAAARDVDVGQFASGFVRLHPGLAFSR